MSRLGNIVGQRTTGKDVVQYKVRGSRQTAKTISKMMSRGYRIQSQTRTALGKNVITFVKQ